MQHVEFDGRKYEGKLNTAQLLKKTGMVKHYEADPHREKVQIT